MDDIAGWQALPSDGSRLTLSLVRGLLTFGSIPKNGSWIRKAKGVYCQHDGDSCDSPSNRPRRFETSAR